MPDSKKTFGNQQSLTQARLLLESITSASGEQIKILDLRIGQRAGQSNVNNPSDMI